MHLSTQLGLCVLACTYNAQDWKPASARGGDSQDSQDADSPTMGPSSGEPAEPPPLGQRLFSDSQELSDLASEIEKALEDTAPRVPVPGPSIPQILGAKPDAGSSRAPATGLETKTVDMCDGSGAANPIPTPCRSFSIPQMDSQTNKAQQDPSLGKFEHTW